MFGLNKMSQLCLQSQLLVDILSSWICMFTEKVTVSDSFLPTRFLEIFMLLHINLSQEPPRVGRIEEQ